MQNPDIPETVLPDMHNCGVLHVNEVVACSYIAC